MENTTPKRKKSEAFDKGYKAGLSKAIELLGEEEPEAEVENCDNCGAEGYGKAWYGHGKPTNDAWGDRYEPIGSIVFCKECAPQFEIGKHWDGEEIWKRTSDRVEHSEIRINSITKRNFKNIGRNQAIREARERIKKEMEK